MEPWLQTRRMNHHLQQQKQRIRQVIIDKWQETYDYGETGNFYSELFPTVDYKPRDQMSPRNKDVQISRLRFGHVRLKKNLHKIGQADSPNCSVCHTEEDIHHFIFECPAQKELQYQLKKVCASQRKSYNMKSVLKLKKYADTLYEYFRSQNIFI